MNHTLKLVAIQKMMNCLPIEKFQLMELTIPSASMAFGEVVHYGDLMTVIPEESGCDTTDVTTTSSN
jgi:hypothetical protein|tara:strand:+ start:753 stop:953 length:201 start_codon:yes stop_codon:yes gene_type:complete